MTSYKIHILDYVVKYGLTSIHTPVYILNFIYMIEKWIAQNISQKLFPLKSTSLDLTAFHMSLSNILLYYVYVSLDEYSRFMEKIVNFWNYKRSQLSHYFMHHKKK